MGLQGISFATEGVERFLLDVLKVDPQDFMGRLEGYAIQGLKGIVFVSICSIDQGEGITHRCRPQCQNSDLRCRNGTSF